MTDLSSSAVETLQYLEGEKQPTRGYYQLTEGGIVRHGYQPQVISPRYYGLVPIELPARPRLYDPKTGKALERVRLWVEPELLPRVSSFLEPYHRKEEKAETRLARFVRENGLTFTWTTELPMILTQPQQIIEAMRAQLANAANPIELFTEKGDVVYFYADRNAWRISPSGHFEAWDRPPKNNPDKFLLDRKHLVYDLMQSAGVADTALLRNEVLYRRRHLGRE